MGKISHRQMLKLLSTSTLSPTKGPGFQAECRAVIAAEWMYHPYHFEMYQS